jgi:flagellar operon protein (TIGR03826 family)
MEVVNCPRCGRVFTRISKPVCPACVKEDEDTFEKVRAYVKENPLCSMKELSDETSVSVKRITQYIRDGRLEISHGMAGEITCTQCGRPILTGRFCEQCAMEIKMTALEKKRETDVKKKPDYKRGGEMHVKR